MAKRKGSTSEWSSVKFSTFRVRFQDDPDVHSYLSSAPDSMQSEYIRVAIKHYLQSTNHPAITKEFQKKIATMGLEAVLDSVTPQAQGSPSLVEIPPAGDPAPSAPPAAPAEQRKPRAVSTMLNT